MSNEQQRCIHITTANGVVVIPEDSTAEEIGNAIKGKIHVIAPIKYELHNYYEDKTEIANSKFYNTIREGELRGKSHHKKHHKPNKGFSLGSYKFKSR